MTSRERIAEIKEELAIYTEWFEEGELTQAEYDEIVAELNYEKSALNRKLTRTLVPVIFGITPLLTDQLADKGYFERKELFDKAPPQIAGK